MGATLVVRRGFAHHEELEFRLLDRPLGRLRGLLGTTSEAAAVALVGCACIHTIGMRYCIDVAFVGSSGIVLEVWRSVPPGRLLGNRRAWVTLERPHRRGTWLARGEKVQMTRMEEVQEDEGNEGSGDEGPTA